MFAPTKEWSEGNRGKEEKRLQPKEKGMDFYYLRKLLRWVWSGIHGTSHLLHKHHTKTTRHTNKGRYEHRQKDSAESADVPTKKKEHMDQVSSRVKKMKTAEKEKKRSYHLLLHHLRFIHDNTTSATSLEQASQAKEIEKIPISQHR